jgi:hypothetical protein
MLKNNRAENSISSFDDENANSNDSSLDGPPKDSFQPTPRSTTPLIYRVTSSADRRFAFSRPTPIAVGQKQPSLPERTYVSCLNAALTG